MWQNLGRSLMRGYMQWTASLHSIVLHSHDCFTVHTTDSLPTLSAKEWSTVHSGHRAACFTNWFLRVMKSTEIQPLLADQWYTMMFAVFCCQVPSHGQPFWWREDGGCSGPPLCHSQVGCSMCNHILIELPYIYSHREACNLKENCTLFVAWGPSETAHLLSSYGMY